MAISNSDIIFPDGESLATKLSGTGSALSVSNNGIELVSSASDINFDTELKAVDDGDGTVTVSLANDFLKLDGSNSMTGTLDLGGNKLLLNDGSVGSFISDVFDDLYISGDYGVYIVSGGSGADLTIKDGLINTRGNPLYINKGTDVDNQLRNDASNNFEFYSDNTMYFFTNGATTFDFMIGASSIDFNGNNAIGINFLDVSGIASFKNTVDMNSNHIVGLPAPTLNSHAATKQYVDECFEMLMNDSRN